jgi:beta-mannosidase
MTNQGCKSGKHHTHMVGIGKGHEASPSPTRLINYRGPTMLTCGPWRPVYLEIYSSRFGDLWFEIELSDSLLEATIATHAEIEPVTSSHKVKFELFDPNGLLVQERTVGAKHGSAVSNFELKSPQLWFPAGNGPQPLYTLKASVLTPVGGVLCTSSKRLGIKRLDLIQRPLEKQPGTTFFFQINNVPVFCRGSN